MTGAVRPWQTEQERRAGGSPDDAWRRGLGALLVLTQPVACLAWLLARAGLSWQRWVKPHIYVPATLAVLVAVILGGGGRLYATPAVELVEFVSSTLRDAAPERFGEPVRRLVLDRGPAWLLATIPLGLALGGFIGAISAALRYRRRASWREDQAAALDVPKDRQAVGKALAKLTEPKPAPARTFADRTVRLGLDMNTRRPYELTTGELAYHAYVDGPSGYGKTTTLIRLAKGLILDQGDALMPFVMVNMKPDTDVTDALRAIAHQGGRRFWRITHDGIGGCPYNPLARGTGHELASAVMKAEEYSQGGGFSEPHYRKTAKRYLNLVASVMVELAEQQPGSYERDYSTLAALMPAAQLALHAHQLSPELGNRVSRYMKELKDDPQLAKDSGGLRQRIAGAAESAAEPVLSGQAGGLVLEDALRAGDVIMFDLDAAADAEAAQLVGNLALADLLRTLARLGAERWNRDAYGNLTRLAPIVVDEFAALGGTLLRDLFQRVRSYGGAVILSTQEAGSLDAADDQFRETVLTNTNVKILHQQEVNAEHFADLMGTESTWEESRQVFEDAALTARNTVYASGQGTLKEVDRYVVNPNVLRHLGIGEVLVRVKSRHEGPAVVAVQRWSSPPVVDTYVSTWEGSPARLQVGRQVAPPPPTKDEDDDVPEVNTAGLWD